MTNGHEKRGASTGEQGGTPLETSYLTYQELADRAAEEVKRWFEEHRPELKGLLANMVVITDVIKDAWGHCAVSVQLQTPEGEIMSFLFGTQQYGKRSPEEKVEVTLLAEN